MNKPKTVVLVGWVIAVVSFVIGMAISIYMSYLEIVDVTTEGGVYDDGAFEWLVETVRAIGLFYVLFASWNYLNFGKFVKMRLGESKSNLLDKKWFQYSPWAHIAVRAARYRATD